MSPIRPKQFVRRAACSALAFACLSALQCPARAASCRLLTLNGEVSAGQEWKTPIGEGWVFRIVPLSPGPRGYSGWDLVVDRDPSAGFPDALLLATPPYNSINERELATTFALRAQDVIGWNPRSFRFLIDPQAFRQGQKLYLSLDQKHPDPRTVQALQDLQRRSVAGQLRILDARIVPGVADAVSYAESWALASARIPHSVEAAGGPPSFRGQLRSIRFSIVLWMPSSWRPAAGLAATPSTCPAIF